VVKRSPGKRVCEAQSVPGLDIPSPDGRKRSNQNDCVGLKSDWKTVTVSYPTRATVIIEVCFSTNYDGIFRDVLFTMTKIMIMGADKA